jgi:hypothetical protein
MPTPLKSALSPAEWSRRQSGALSVDVVDVETHVAVRDPDGEVVTVSGNDELFALMALANSALTEDEPRKLCRRDLAVLSILIEEYHHSQAGDRQILEVGMMLYDKLAALLPGTGRNTPPTGTDVP